MEKVAKNGRKVKAIALLKMLKMDEKLRLPFFCFLRTYEKWKKSLKMDEKLRL
jgi:hypothetical protein